MELNSLEIFKNAWSIFWSFWPLFVILLAVFIVKIVFIFIGRDIKDIIKGRKFKKGEEWRSDRDLLKWLRGMHPTEFEEYIADLFNRLGYKARAVGKSHDGGIDVIAEKDGITNYIQCKKFITSEVRLGDVRDFYGALADHLANGNGYFITTNKFTIEAQRFTEDKPIELIDGFKLIEYINMVKNKEGINITKDSKTDEKCPLCNGKLVVRKGKFGLFYGCSNYPKCKYTTR